ncbi:hypothetical protein ACQ4PT_013763 [Festuca glaucescens]
METSRGCHRPPPAGKSSRHNRTSKLRRVLLDSSVHHACLAGRDGTADCTLSEISSTCTGKPIAASLIVAEPPAISHLHLHWPEGSRPELTKLRKPSIITANGDYILFEAFVPLLSGGFPHDYPIDYFVYTASRSDQKPPSLTRLPLCDIGGSKDPAVDRWYSPYHKQQQRQMWSEDMGLLCRGSGKFTVAELKYNGELCVLRHAPDEDENPQSWELQEVQMQNDLEGTPALLFGSWKTDAVLAFGGRYLCWADCYLGLLFVDVLDDNHTQPPRYVPLPEGLDPHRVHTDPADPEPARHVCVVGTAVIKLISICDDAGHSAHPQSSCSSDDFTIKIWTLTDFKKMRWENVAVMHGTDVSAALGSDKRLPSLILPQFPLLSLADSDVIYFQLNERDRTWLIEVNMKKKVLGAVTLCNDEEVDRNMTISSFIPSQFSR